MRASFFEKITGSVRADSLSAEPAIKTSVWVSEREEEAEMVIDMYQSKDDITVVAMIAGVKPSDLDVSINNDVLKIEAKRNEPEKINPENYLARELYWGPFSRSVVLPSEVDPDKIDAETKDGMLILKMPKIDRTKSKILKVKSV
ncbi:MAG: Hsp20/alpha crystallin family protein [Candidatus Paceibacterota bacterium]|jgi:HSP20 family protein